MSLRVNHISQAAYVAIKQIEDAREGKFQGLKSRWEELNNILPRKRFLFGKGYVLAGMSGVSKSYFLNMLYQDFFNPDINSDFESPFIGLHFALEMPASDEVIRNLSYKTQLTMDTMLSVDSVITDSNLNLIKEKADEIRELPLYYCETTGNVEQIETTIDEFANSNAAKGKKLIVSLDHTLLVDYLTERDEIALVTAISKLFLKKRKAIDCMTIMISQLNADIEDQQRRSEDPRLAHLHYPIRKDIHGSKSVFRDADNVLVLHAPAKLGISRYGKEKLSTVFNNQPVIYLHQIKARGGVDGGVVAFENNLNKGYLTEIPLDVLKPNRF